ncbi:CASP-like protein 3A1 [Cucurbita maxima]|uniref:CASP-like protein n=1 Tax=Cucurbita maxima TaxID=3661 RepID=A0A6J1KMH1_CUCMA|nr:CASP-like protein 3A1 [Cucurbita maxima]
MAGDRKMSSVPEVAVQLPEMTKVAAMASKSGTIGGLIEPSDRSLDRLRADLCQLMLRLICVATSVTAMSLMVTAAESSTVSIYGFELPVHSNWSFSDVFEYLVGVSGAVAVYSLLQLLVTTSKLIRKSPVLGSRSQAWLIFAVDLALAYALMSAGSAAAGISNLNRTGIRHTTLPNFCKPLQRFCNHVAISIAFTFFTCCLLTTSAIQYVIWLSKN